MKIKNIKISNFRSIKSANFDTTNFNIFVGQNNCGKTNFFEAIEFFFNGIDRNTNIDHLKFKKDKSLEIRVEIEFIGSLQGAEVMNNATNKTKIEKALNDNDTVTFIRSSLDISKRIMIVNGEEIHPGTGFDKALNDFLPKYEYVNTKQYYDSVAKYGKTTPMGKMLSGVLLAIIETDDKYKAFQKIFTDLFQAGDSKIKKEFEKVGTEVQGYLKKQFADCSNVEFGVETPIFEDLLKNFSTIVDDGISTTAEEKGDGMQRALMLAIIQAYADFRKREEVGKSFLFFIDEAELHLHPSAQRNLKNVLYSLSESNDQVFINTHSSVFIADDMKEQSIFKIEKNNSETSIEKLIDDEKPYLVFELLGGSPTDLLLPHNFLIVEGVSEFEFLSRVISRFYKEKPKIQIIKANGDIEQTKRSINAIEKIYTPLNVSIYKNRLVLLFDKYSDSTESSFNDFKKQNKCLENNKQIFTIPFRDIEQYYPNKKCPTYTNWKKTQDEVDKMNGHKKKQLAKFVGDNITKKAFEETLSICFQALERCWELAL